ncbi:hypothetical protein [Bradyrhizobium elkanii]|uniref:hypothetical protein n=1 Tax=Bradyrhizobium elkanii TaxID=29448 RepID=UPI003D1B3914
MRVTIEHREERSPLGRLRFFVDTTVEFSEAERTVIRHRQLGDHYIEVGTDTPEFRTFWGFVAATSALRLWTILSAVAILPAGILLNIWGFDYRWWMLLILSCLASYLYRKYLDRRLEKSVRPRQFTLSRLLKDGRFTVYAPDAYLAQEAEKGIAAGLNDLKSRMVAVAPGLAQKQVYAREP